MPAPCADRHWTQRLAAVLGADPNLTPEDVDTDAGNALQYQLGGISVSVDDDGDHVGTDRSLEFAGVPRRRSVPLMMPTRSASRRLPPVLR